MKIYILPCSEIVKEMLPELSKNIEETFGYKTEIKNENIDFEFAYNNDRKQYFSPSILGKLKDIIPKDALKLLAIVDIDLYDTGLNFIFGEATDKICLVSIHRFKPCLWKNEKKEKEILYQRLLKTSIHELGHTFGFSHCENPSCVMFFSNWLGDTDRKSHKFCNKCLKRKEVLLK